MSDSNEKHPATKRPDATTNKVVKDKGEPKKTSDSKSKSEVGGRGGLDPTRYGDWEIGGRCVDF